MLGVDFVDLVSSVVFPEINEKEMKETIVKIQNTKSWFFEKINKIGKPLARLIKKKREKNKINKIKNENGEVTTDNSEIQRIIRNYYEQLYSNKIKNLEEMDRFLEKFNLPRMNQEEIETINNSIAAAAAKSLQSCPTLCNPVDGSPPGSPVPGILQARTLEWVAISISNA